MWMLMLLEPAFAKGSIYFCGSASIRCVSKNSLEPARRTGVGRGGAGGRGVGMVAGGGGGGDGGGVRHGVGRQMTEEGKGSIICFFGRGACPQAPGPLRATAPTKQRPVRRRALHQSP